MGGSRCWHPVDATRCSSAKGFAERASEDLIADPARYLVHDGRSTIAVCVVLMRFLLPRDFGNLITLWASSP